MNVAGLPGFPGKVASTTLLPGSALSWKRTSAWPVTVVKTVKLVEPLDESSASGVRSLPLPWITLKVTGIESMPLQESLTQTRSDSGKKALVSAFWLFPAPMLIWLARACFEDAQKKTLLEMPVLVTHTRLFPQPAAPPSVQYAEA